MLCLSAYCRMQDFFINKTDEEKEYFGHIVGGHQPILNGVLNFEETKLVHLL